MLTDFLAKYKRPLITVAALIILGSIAWAIYYAVFVFHVTSVTPDPKGLSYLSPELTVEFNKDVADNPQVSSSDLQITHTVDGKKLIFEILSDMKANQKYTITLGSVRSKGGDEIKDYSIVVIPSTSTSLSSSALKTVLDRQQANKSAAVKEPIFNYLPHSTLDYSIDAAIYNATTPLERAVITITIQLSAADAKTNKEGSIERYKKEAMEYLDSLKGIDLSRYTIELSVVDPTL